MRILTLYGDHDLDLDPDCASWTQIRGHSAVCIQVRVSSKSESGLNPDTDTNSDPDAWRTFSAVICCLLTVNEHSLTFLTVVNESHDQVVKPVIRYLEAFSCPVNLSPFDFMT